MMRRHASLRARFAFLITGSVILPPFIFGIMGLIASALNMAPDGTSSYIVLRHLIREGKRSAITVESLVPDLAKLADESAGARAARVSPEVFLIDGDGVLRFPADRAGTRSSVDALLEQTNGTGARYVSVIPVVDGNGGTGYVVLASEPNALLSRVFALGFIAPLVFLVFISTMSVLIIRSINASISRLEQATRQIASGDLDFELRAEGGDVLASLTRSLESMRGRLKEQFDRDARFLMGISHDLRTPLASITGYVGVIRDGHADSPEKLDRYTGIIDAKARLLESRITSLIDYARQETSDWKVTLTEVDACEFFGEAIELAGVEARARGFCFDQSVDLPPGVTIRLDPGMISRAFENLIENAFRYTPEGGTIGCTAECDERSIRLSVMNSGPGIAADDLPHIFEPLYRASGDRKGSGFGLGLSIVRSVIASHGWSIDVQSRPDAGTVFTVTIPLQQPV